MELIKLGDSGAAVEDVQTRLTKVELLEVAQVSGTFDDATARAVQEFCKVSGLSPRDFIDDEVWGELVEASYSLGDRTLYLRLPHFRGADCKQLQHILGVLGFSVGVEDGIFGAVTESALRVFQQNMGLPCDGIVGALTYQSIRNLHHSWEDKEAYKGERKLNYARAAEVLENNTFCLYGSCDFSRSIAKRMSNLSLATSPQSKIVSADQLSVAPDSNMILFQITLDEEKDESVEAKEKLDVIEVLYTEDGSLTRKLQNAISAARESGDNRISVFITHRSWETAKDERSAQHYAINLLDGLCSALSNL